jgi:RNA polymerase sigma factor (sigma-70 family)
MPLPALLRFLYAAPAEGVSDADLLRRFAAVRDEAAFELLVRRHADLVWKVCRGVLRQEADAEDAFQATFLALARKAGSVRDGCAAGWLHRVALHAALKLRAKKRYTAELPDVPAPAGPDPALAAVVHEEVERLGDRYRLPVLLCDLEGHTHAEAAKVLGWPVGTVSGRLSRGRDRLRQRLERRGVALGLAAITGTASGNLVRSAVSAVGGGASPAVVSLTEGVLFAMRTAKLKLVAAVSVVAVGLVGTGTIVAVGQERKAEEGGKPAPSAKAEAVKPDPEWNEGTKSAFPDIKPLDLNELEKFTEKHATPALESDPPLRKLQKAKLRAAMEQLKLEREFRRLGDPRIPYEFTMNTLHQIIRDAVETGVELSDRREDQHAWLEFGVRVCKEYEALTKERANQGVIRPSDQLSVHRHRLDAEIALLKHAQQRDAK